MIGSELFLGLLAIMMWFIGAKIGIEWADKRAVEQGFLIHKGRVYDVTKQE